MVKRCAIGVMAKAPVPGRAKTRLTSVLSDNEAAALSAAFLTDITHNIAAAAEQVPVDGWIAYAPAGTGHLFDPHVAPGTQLILADGALALPSRVRGLGRALLHAMHGLLARGYHAACLVNSDSPTLPTSRMVQAVSLLLQDPGQVVLGPAEDGGYYLIGMGAAHAAVFEDIAWSTEAVAAQTRVQAAKAGLRLTDLDPWYDVDSPALLDRLTAELRQPGPGYAAPATRACMAQLTRRERVISAK